MTAITEPVVPGAGPQILQASSERTLVEQIVDWYSARIGEGLMRPGSRLPSIRRFAQQHRVSRFTVVEAYDRLIARGLAESRQGSGFFVRASPARLRPAPVNAWAEAPRPDLDVVWLLRNMFRQMPAADMPGGGVLPREWLDEEIVAAGLRAIGRQHAASLLEYGHPQGYLPLREQLSVKLAEQEIHARAEQILTTNGATQALDLVAQRLIRPGDTVLVDEPAWFLLFGRFATLGARLIGVPRLADGPDMDRLRTLAETTQPRLYITSSVLHNPTGSSISAAKAFALLQLAETHDFKVVDDDVYGDLQMLGVGQGGVRLGALDQLRRVIHLGGFSKTLAANLRVGFIACAPELAREMTDLKMLVGLTSPEIGERIVYRVLSEGQYRRHTQRLRERMAQARGPVVKRLEDLGFTPFAGAAAGMFVWADAGIDTGSIARTMFEHGYLMAPGSLFLPDQRPSTWMRFNVATTQNPRMLARFETVLASARRRATAGS